MKNYRKLFSALGMIVLLAGLMHGCAPKEKKLLIYCAKSMYEPVEEIKSDFEQRFDVTVNMISAGTMTLVETIRETKKGDIFIPGASFAVDSIADLVYDRKIIAGHEPVVVVHKDNLEKISSFDDLAKPGVKIGIGEKKACTVGQAAEEIIQRSSLRERLWENVTVKTPTSVELLNLLQEKEIDAAITYKNLVLWSKYYDLTYIKVPPELKGTHAVPVALLTCSKDKANSELFMNFVADEGKKVFRKWGFGEK